MNFNSAICRCLSWICLKRMDGFHFLGRGGGFFLQEDVF